MTLLSPLPRLAAHGLILALVVSCALGPSLREQIDQAQLQAQQLIAQGDLEGASAALWKVSEQAQSPQLEELQLRAVEILLTPGTRQLARDYLSRIDETGMVGETLARKRIDEAELLMLFEQPAMALKALSAGLDDQAPGLAPRMDELRARALLASGQVLAAVKTRLRRSQRLLDPQRAAANRDALWAALGQATAQQLLQWGSETTDPRLKGWLDLAHIAKTAPAEKGAFRRQLSDWGQAYPGHAAIPEIVDQVLRDWQALQFQPRRIAVLLPLSGRYAQAARAVMAGIAAAFYTEVDRPETPVIQVYDLGDRPKEAVDWYRRAVDEGAQIVIGPLSKHALHELAQLPEFPVPVLSLNYLDASASPPTNLYQFGLSPEDEAAQVAERASLDNRHRALALVPSGTWGQRLFDAFDHRHQELGGEVLALEHYAPQGADFSTPIKHALLIDQSERRYQTLKQTLRRDIKFTPRRRQDADMVFLAAFPRQARLLRPQLRFYYAGDLQVYATSHIYTGFPDPMADRDMDDIVFCDMPWNLEQGGEIAGFRTRMDELFPSQTRSTPRLVALGLDAYRLVPFLKRLAARPFEHYGGYAGQLSMDGNGAIHRQLRWARLSAGRPELVHEEPAPPQPETLPQ
jgi:outer membrane PBP1 activator LpoA protein